MSELFGMKGVKHIDGFLVDPEFFHVGPAGQLEVLGILPHTVQGMKIEERVFTEELHTAQHIGFMGFHAENFSETGFCTLRHCIQSLIGNQGYDSIMLIDEIECFQIAGSQDANIVNDKTEGVHLIQYQVDNGFKLNGLRGYRDFRLQKKQVFVF